jgi:hypothetical protein
MRAVMSGWPPGVKPTTMRIGRLGNPAASACARADVTAPNAMPDIAMAIEVVLVICMVSAGPLRSKRNCARIGVRAARGGDACARHRL